MQADSTDGAFDAHAAKRSAALQSAVAAAGITALKLVTGIASGSIGMLSEAAHSGIDLLASAITLFSIRISDRPADEDHTYGHGRVESLSAFVETGFMLLSAAFIVGEAIRRGLRYARGERLDLHISVWPVVVLLLSIAVDYTRSRHLRKVAKLSNSQALEAEALHFGTDIWSSIAVLIGLLASFIGERLHIRALELADPVAAIVVSIVILRVTLQLARETVNVLIDAAPPELRQQLIAAVRSVNGVLSVDSLRLRRAGSHYFADVSVAMPRSLTFQRSEQLVFAVTAAVQGIVTDADVVVRTVPVAGADESVFDRVRAVALRANLAIHDVSVQQREEGLAVEMHLELPEETPLRDAHEMATRIEADIHREVPQVHTIVTHLESEESTISKVVAVADDRAQEMALRRCAAAFQEIVDVHSIVALRAGGHLQMSCHCSMPDALPMGDVHRIISELEQAFLRTRPEVARLLIHPEPLTDS